MLRILILIFAVFIANSAFAQTKMAPCVTTSTGVCNAVSASNPLNVTVIGTSGATSGYVYTSNGPGAAATFQPSSSGSGTVSLGTQGYNAYYATTGTVVSGTSSVFIGTTGLVGINTTSPSAGAALDLSANTTSANSSILLPIGTTGTRPTTGINGMIRYNSTAGAVEAYENNNWTQLAANGYTYNLQPSVNFIHGTASLLKAAQGTAMTKWLAIGDSTTFGIGSPNSTSSGSYGEKSWPSQIAMALRYNGYNATANGYWGYGASTVSAQYRCGLNGDSTKEDARFTCGTGWTEYTTNSIIGGYTYSATATGNPIVFTPDDNAWDSIITYWIGSTNTNNVSIQIGTQTASTFSTTSGTTAIVASPTYTATGGVGFYPITYNYVNGTIDYQLGAIAWDSTKPGIVVTNAGWPGATSTNISSGFTRWNQLSALAPSVCLIEGGLVNDWKNNVGVATSQANLQTMISACQAANADPVLVTAFPSSIGVTALATQQAYTAMEYALAIADNIPLIDVFGAYQSYEIQYPQGLYASGDSLHPNMNGYAYAAKLVATGLTAYSGSGANIVGTGGSLSSLNYVAIGTSTIPPLGGLITTGSTGIGTTSPAYALDIYQNTASTDAYARIQNAASGNGSYLQVTGNSNYVSTRYFGTGANWFTGEFGTGSFKIEDGTNSTFPFAIQQGAPTTSFVISSTGQIGLGTNSTSALSLGNAAAHAGQATCWTTNGAIGYCTSVVSSSGGCTCTGL